MYPYLKMTCIVFLLSVTTKGISQTKKDAIPNPMETQPMPPIIPSSTATPIPPVDDPTPQPPMADSIRKNTHRQPVTGNADQNPRIGFFDTASTKAYYDALTEYYNTVEAKNVTNAQTIDSVGSYYIWALKNRQFIIERQQITGSLIFALVTLLVLAGLAFSVIQFRIALKSINKRSAHSLNVTSFKASLTGIEVSSSILGIIILALSLAFFYLYLTNVYPLVSLDQLPHPTPGK